jgi:enoyl-CoA hydratase
MEKSVLVAQKDGKGIITINRPQVLNAIDWDTFFLFQDMFNLLDNDDAIQVIIITGAGSKAFISGGDIGAELKMNGLESYRWSLTGHKLCSSIENSAKPVIAAVNGYSLGGGFEIMLACDFIICSDNAKFGAPEVGLGVICGFGGNIRLPRKIGVFKAKEMLMTGKFIDAQEAYRLNLVNKVVPLPELMEEVDKFCLDLLNKNTITLDLVKRAVNYGLETDLRTAIQYDAGLFGLVSATDDKVEGMSAFMEKRKPVWRNK